MAEICWLVYLMASYTINYGLALFLLDTTMKEVNSSPKYVIIWWESQQKAPKRTDGYFCEVLGLWEKHNKMKCMNSDFKGGSDVEQILDIFLNGSRSHNAKKLLQISVDGVFTEKRSLNDFLLFSNLGTCGLRTCPGSFKMASRILIGTLDKYWDLFINH